MTGFGRGVAEHGRRRARPSICARSTTASSTSSCARSIAPSLEEQVATRIRGAIERGAVAVSVHVARAGARRGARIDEAAPRGPRTRSRGARAPRSASPAGSRARARAARACVLATDDREDASEAAILAALDSRARAAPADARRRGARARARARWRGSTSSPSLRTRDRRRSPAGVAEQLAQKLAERLRRLARRRLRVDPARLAQEVALLAERADITEELVRLASHLEQARTLIATAAAPSGRKLDFLVQEIGRELNTIGSQVAAHRDQRRGRRGEGRAREDARAGPERRVADHVREHV